MTHRTRMALFLSQFLGATFASGCDIFPPGDAIELDDVACLNFEIEASCPGRVEARAELVGTEICDDPVREIVAIGALLSEEDVVVPPADDSGDSGDSGLSYTECCYEAAYVVRTDSSCTIGRPLVVDGRTVSAASTERADWVADLSPNLAGLSDEARTALAETWRDAGLLEHASVPAFARVLLDLVALGAPAELVDQTAAAIRDEVVHARACFALASAYAGRPVGPGPLPVPLQAAPDFVRLAVETFREGCVGETLAVGLAAAQLRRATDPAVRAVLLRIVEDEGTHAALAWDIVRWAVAQGGDEARQAVARAVQELRPDTFGGAMRPGPAATAAHGLADPETARTALDGVWRTVIAPGAAELLAA